MKIDEDIFVIPEGTINLSMQHLMQGREYTLLELEKLKRQRNIYRKMKCLLKIRFMIF